MGSQLCPVCQPPKNMVHYIKVISNTTQHVFKHIWENTQNPRKNCSKKPENKSSWDPHSPGVNHPHDQKYTPHPLLDIPQDAPRGNFCSDLSNDRHQISPMLLDVQAPLILVRIYF